MHNAIKAVWEETAVAAPSTQSLARSMRADVAIVGGGFTGLGAAIRLAASGKSVVVLEAGRIGAGASGRNGGQVVPGLKYDPDDLLRLGGEKRGQALLDFAGNGAARTFEFIKEHQIQCHAQNSGWVQPAVTPAQLKTVTARAEQWRKHGVAIRILDGAESEKITGTSSYVGGWVDPRGGTLQPLSYVRELARVAQQSGAEIFTDTSVRALEQRDGTWRLDAGDHEVEAGQVILATNGYMQKLLPDLNASFFPSHSVQVATEPLGVDIRNHIMPAGLPVSDSRRLLKYMRFDPEGRFMIGGRGSFGHVESGRYFAGLKAYARRMFPALEGVKWTHHWAGKIALTLDHLPHIHNPQPGLYAALGYNGRGVALATQIGGLLAEVIDGRPHDECPLPVTNITKIPLHILRRPAIEAAVLWYRLLDGLGR